MKLFHETHINMTMGIGKFCGQILYAFGNNGLQMVSVYVHSAPLPTISHSSMHAKESFLEMKFKPILIKLIRNRFDQLDNQPFRFIQALAFALVRKFNFNQAILTITMRRIVYRCVCVQIHNLKNLF